MSGSRWVITPLWLSGSWRYFLYSFSVYSCYLFLISSASVRSIPFLSFIVPICAWNVPLVSLIFLKRSLVFPILLFSSIYLHWSLKKAFLSLLGVLKKKSILTSPLFLIAHAKRTGFAISKRFHLTRFLQGLKNIIAILCQKFHLSFFIAIVS